MEREKEREGSGAREKKSKPRTATTETKALDLHPINGDSERQPGTHALTQKDGETDI